jgi:hypothetical protein
MIRIIILICFLITTNIIRAEDTNSTIEIKTLMSVPEKRHAALVLYAVTGDDSTADISTKRENYYNALKQIAQGLRDRYCWHDEYPTNVFAGIEDHADVLVAAKYPISKTTGASYVDYLKDSYRIKMAEETISFMAKAIFNRLKDSDIKIADKSVPSFGNWNKEWEAAGNIPNGPNKNLAPIVEK